MKSLPPSQPSLFTHDTIEAALKQYGIVRIPTDTFHYGGYCYTNIEDAIAEAIRHPVRTSACDAEPALVQGLSR